MAYSVVLHVVMLLSLSFVTTHGVRGEYRTKTAVEICEQNTAQTEPVDKTPAETTINLSCDCKAKESCGGSELDEHLPKDCFDLLQQGHTKDGSYNIYPFGKEGPLLVYCDMTTESGGWTVFQKREDDSVDFYRAWDEYRDGFGYPGGDFWLGNKYLFMITNQKRYTLRVDLEDFEGEKRYAEYDHFRVSDETTKFKLALGFYSGTAGDSLSLSANMKFTTWDEDNDMKIDNNCAIIFESAWWYNNCYAADLNGQYLGAAQDTLNKGVIWDNWKGPHSSLRLTEMKIRPFGALKN